MTDLISELKALKEKATPGPWRPSDGYGDNGCYFRGLQSDMGEIFGEFSADQEDIYLIAALVNHLPTILARLEEGERMREALGRLVSEYDDDGEHGKHAYEQECPLCCAIEDARKFTALEPTHDH